MKKIATLFILSLFVLQSSFAGGIVTNTNQSALMVRMLARNASTDIDAVFFNPAGLVKMKDGLYLSVHNQTIFQTKTITNDFALLNESEFIGDVKAPLFPTGFLAWKKGKLAISFGFGPVGGGGSASYSKGLPSIEYQIAALPSLVQTLTKIPTDGYSVDVNFDGSSVYWGAQMNISYAINKMIALSVGGRYLMATNTYEGCIENIKINPNFPKMGFNGDLILAKDFFNALGQPDYVPMVSDKEINAKQTGSAFTPIVGLNISPTSRLNFGFKYEFATKLELTNETTIDDVGMFPDGAVSRNDMPAYLAAGASYYVTKKLKTSVSYSTYFDKNADWGGRELEIDKNSSDLSIGLEYLAGKRLTVSGGYSLSSTGVKETYQSDMSYSLGSSTVGFGFQYRATNKLSVDLGFLYVMYQEGERTHNYEFMNMPLGPATEKYEKSVIDFGIGITYRIF